jgi:putative sterol carrier protein
MKSTPATLGDIAILQRQITDVYSELDHLMAMVRGQQRQIDALLMAPHRDAVDMAVGRLGREIKAEASNAN